MTIAARLRRGSPGLRVIGNEAAKGLRLTWSRKAMIPPQLAVMLAMYWAIQFIIGGGRMVEPLVAITVFGYWAYVIGYVTLIRMTAGVLEEKFAGTLEQSLLSPVRPWLLSVGRLGAAVLEGLLVASTVTGLTVAILTVDIPFTWPAVLPLLLTVVDLAGFALLIGGLALVVNAIGSIAHVIQGVLVLLNGAFVPIYLYPHWLEIIAKFVPSTLGIDVARRMLFADESLATTWSNGSLPLALGHAGLTLVIGWAVFQLAIRRGLRTGRLGA